MKWAALLLAFTACVPFIEKETRVQKLQISSQPPGAEVTLDDADGARVLGNAPLSVDAKYDVTVYKFNPTALIGPIAGAICLVFGLNNFPNFHDDIDAPHLLGYTATIVGAAAIIGGLIDVIIELVQNGEPAPDPIVKEYTLPAPFSGLTDRQEKRLKESAYGYAHVRGSLPGFGDHVIDLGKPPTSGDVRLTLYPLPYAVPQAKPPPAAPPVAPAPEPASCATDKDCPGELICEQSKCVTAPK